MLTSTRATLALHAEFGDARGYLAACTVGLPTIGTRVAMLAELSGRPDPGAYSRAVEAVRGHFARLVRVAPTRVAIGAQTSVMVGAIATAVPDGGVVLCPTDDFSSLTLPFVHAGRGIRVRTAPLATLAEAVTDDVDMVAFSIVQSASGEVADVEAIIAAARAAGARAVCDATQATGWLSVDASRLDAVVCHAYKWLCAPRGVGFLALSPALAAEMSPRHAGWYAGAEVWSSCYGTEVSLADDARRFDISPAWQAFVGAEPALRAFADADADAVAAWCTGLAADFRERMGLAQPERPSAIVTWADADGSDLARLTAAGVTASGRNGCARVAFHVFNADGDVDLAVRALGR